MQCDGVCCFYELCNILHVSKFCFSAPYLTDLLSFNVISITVQDNILLIALIYKCSYNIHNRVKGFLFLKKNIACRDEAEEAW